MTPKDKLQELALRYQKMPTDANYEAVAKMLEGVIIKISDYYQSEFVPFEDLQQEGRIAVLEMLGTYVPCGGSFWTVVHRAIRSRIQDSVRYNNGVVRVPVDAYEEGKRSYCEGFRPSHENIPDRCEKSPETPLIVQQLISTLSPDEQKLLTLYYTDQHSRQAIGDSLGISESATRKRIAVCLRKLRKEAVTRGLSADLLLCR